MGLPNTASVTNGTNSAVSTEVRGSLRGSVSMLSPTLADQLSGIHNLEVPATYKAFSGQYWGPTPESCTC